MKIQEALNALSKRYAIKNALTDEWQMVYQIHKKIPHVSKEYIYSELTRGVRAGTVERNDRYINSYRRKK